MRSASEIYMDLIPSLHWSDGRTEIQAKCPLHADEIPSLSINTQKDKWFCHACNKGGTAVNLYMEVRGIDFKTAMKNLSSGQTEARNRKVVATYDYTDEVGKLVFQVVRMEPKIFRQRRPDGNGGWIWNTEGIRLVPYRLPEVLKAEIIYIPEGERDCETLRNLGLTATTNPRGAGKWRSAFNEYFKDKNVVILCDNDRVGRDHARDVARNLYGIARSVRIIELPGLPEKGDITDWINTGGTKEKLIEIVKAMPSWKVVEVQNAKLTQRGLIFTHIKDLLLEPEDNTAWLVDRRLPASGLSILAGKPKAGKSTLARNLALSVARGSPWLGISTRQGVVLYLALEEKRSEVRNHFRNMGITSDDPLFVFVAPSPQDGIKELDEAARQRKPALVIVDPLLKFIRLRDANDYAAVTLAIEPLLTLARETGAHVMTVHHLGKGERSGGDAILGSTAIFAAVDTALLLKRTDRYRTLSSIQRYGDDLEEMTLDLDDTGRITAGPPQKEAEESQMGETILEFLQSQDSPVDEKTIQEGVEGRRAVKVRSLRSLVSQKRINKSGRGGKGDPYKYSCSLVPWKMRILLPNLCFGNKKMTCWRGSNLYSMNYGNTKRRLSHNLSLNRSSINFLNT